mmetsp:Transcript_25377/g.31273  ORF Transcript_25377/g.31273 Transcript_25377/m.31273 type:complete len:335 (+) Transcript_25377:77-1081(+)
MQNNKGASSLIDPPMYFIIRFTKPCLFMSILCVSAFILLLAETTYSTQKQKDFKNMEESLLERPTNPLSHHHVDNHIASSSTASEENNNFESHSVKMTLPYGSGTDKTELSYYKCGSTITTTTNDPKSKNIEIVLLHGAAFTKENWVESGILNDLCIRGNKDNNNNNNNKNQKAMSIAALDLSVNADGLGFKDAFDALVEENVLSGKPVVVISPSASGKSIVSLGSYYAQTNNDKNKNLIQNLVKVWVPVASPAVLKERNDSSFDAFKSLNIPILAINGDGDAMGGKVTKRLVDVANAESLEIHGGHPCYLDSPIDFVDGVLSFLDGLQFDNIS